MATKKRKSKVVNGKIRVSSYVRKVGPLPPRTKAGKFSRPKKAGNRNQGSLF
jgi:hypothetical protein